MSNRNHTATDASHAPYTDFTPLDALGLPHRLTKPAIKRMSELLESGRCAELYGMHDGKVVHSEVVDACTIVVRNGSFVLLEIIDNTGARGLAVYTSSGDRASLDVLGLFE